MLLRLAPAIVSIFALYQHWAHGTQLVKEVSEGKVKEIMKEYSIPFDLYPGITEYIDKIREWTSIKIEDILFHNNKVNKTVEPVKLAANDATFTETQTA